MKRNERKQILSVILAAVFTALFSGCASVSPASGIEDAQADMPVDRGTGTF